MAPTKSPLPRTDEDDEDDNNQKRKSLAGSISTLSDLADSFYDASDALDEGLEEFHLDEQISPDLGHPSRITNHESHSSLILGDSSSIDTDIVPDEPPEHDHSAVVRRKQLPSPVTGDEGSLFAILKKNVGKVRMSTSPINLHLDHHHRILQQSQSQSHLMSLLPFCNVPRRRWNISLFWMMPPPVTIPSIVCDSLLPSLCLATHTLAIVQDGKASILSSRKPLKTRECPSLLRKYGTTLWRWHITPRAKKRHGNCGPLRPERPSSGAKVWKSFH